MKKFTALLLIFSLMAISCATITSPRMERKFPERKQGAIIITKKNGYQTEGELIAVKQNSLLLLSITGRDVSVDIEDIKVVTIVKKSKAGLGAGIGFLICGGVGALIGSKSQLTEGDELMWALIFGGFAGLGGFVIGAFGGAMLGTDEKIQIEGMTDSEIREALDKLRKKARIRDYK